jgi:hypothetical protein
MAEKVTKYEIQEEKEEVAENVATMEEKTKEVKGKMALNLVVVRLSSTVGD